jgi:Fur family transcriptional regulator, zinc uptake regulator
MSISYAAERGSPTEKAAAAKAVTGTLSHAEDLCRKGGVKLTASRRRILEILAAEGRPLGAYDLIEKVAQTADKRPAPISIYRALDFLLENGLIHRLASRNAYLACGHGHGAQEPVIFLICDNCGAVTEATSDTLLQHIHQLVDEAKFIPRVQVMEIAGLCSKCSLRADTAPEARDETKAET